MAALLVFFIITILSGNVAKAHKHTDVERRENAACVDSPVCSQVSGICQGADHDLIKSLCPVLCGHCPTPGTNTGCTDSSKINCTEVKHEVCTFESAFLLCPRTCNICDQDPLAHPCKDIVTGLRCEDLPDPCSDVVGRISCPLFCNICTKSTPSQSPSSILQVTNHPTTTLPVTLPTSGPCDVSPCLNGGVCVANNGFKFTCSCLPDYSGPLCDIEPKPTTQTSTTGLTSSSASPASACALVTCLNGGVCSEINGAFVCLCRPGFVHPFCSIATTTAVTASPTTTAPTNLTETTTTMAPTLAGLCATNPCLNGGVCKETNVGFECYCPQGFMHPVCLPATTTAGTSTPTTTTAAPTTTTATTTTTAAPTTTTATTTTTTTTAPTTTTTSTTTIITTTTTPTNPTQTTITMAPTLAGLCATNPCLNGGICKETNVGFECYCPAGYMHPVCLPVTTHSPTTTTLPSTTTTTMIPTKPVCAHTPINKFNVGCHTADVIFLVEYAGSDGSHCGLDHEGDFIKQLVKTWHLENRGNRFGVVTYHDTVEQRIYLSEYEHNPQDLDAAITRITGVCQPFWGQHGEFYQQSGGLRPSGTANLTKALDFVMEKSFKDARPGVQQVVIPIIHNMLTGNSDRLAMVTASQRLKDMCTLIMTMAVSENYNLDRDTVHKIASFPYKNFHQVVNSFDQLESASQPLWNGYGRTDCH